jgi:hypothetical protein
VAGASCAIMGASDNAASTTLSGLGTIKRLLGEWHEWIDSYAGNGC